MRGAAFILLLALWPATALAGLTEAQVGAGCTVATTGSAGADRARLQGPRRTRRHARRCHRRAPDAAAAGRLHLHADLRTGAVDRGRRAEPDRTSGRARLQPRGGRYRRKGQHRRCPALYLGPGRRARRLRAHRQRRGDRFPDGCDRLPLPARLRQRRHRPSGRLRHARRGRPGVARAVEPRAATDRFAAGAAGSRGRQDRRHRRPDRVALLRL